MTVTSMGMVVRDYPFKNKTHRIQARKWLIQVIIVSAIGGVINMMFIATAQNSNSTAFFFIFITNIAVALVNVYLLFGHIDRLIIKRIQQAEDRDDI